MTFQQSETLLSISGSLRGSFSDTHRQILQLKQHSSAFSGLYFIILISFQNLSIFKKAETSSKTKHMFATLHEQRQSFPLIYLSGCIEVNHVRRVFGRVERCGRMPGDGWVDGWGVELLKSKSIPHALGFWPAPRRKPHA